MNVFELFLICTGFTGFVIPLLFVQNGSIANTLQFSYYTLEVTSIFFVIWLVSFLRNRSFITRSIVIILFLLLAIPTSIKTAGDYLIRPERMVINAEENDAFYALQKITTKNDVILLPATQEYTTSLVLGALADRKAFYSDRLMAENTHKDFKQREQETIKFFNSKDTGWNALFLKNNRISYVYLDKAAEPDFKAKFYPLSELYNNNRITIYKVL